MCSIRAGQYCPDQISVIQNKCDKHTLKKSRLKTNLSSLDTHIHTHTYIKYSYIHTHIQPGRKNGLKTRIYEIEAYVCFLLINNNKYNTIIRNFDMI